MKVAVIYNKVDVSDSDVINVFGMQTKERYHPKMVEHVASSLEKGGHNVRTIEGNMNVIDELQNFMPRVVRGERPGMVFNMAYGIQGQSRYTHIPAMLEMLGIPYIGSNPSGHAIALDKVLAKIIFLQHGLPTPAFWLVSGPDDPMENLKFPVIVKPKMEAVSFGLRVARSKEELRPAVEAITREFQQQALVEAFIPGREFAVGLLGNGSNLETFPIVEIDLRGDPDAFQTLEDKTQQPRKKICPADVPESAADELRSLAIRAFNAVGLYDFSRVDFRMDRNGALHILEINSMASLNMTGSYVHAAEVAGLDFTALINRMIDVAAARYFGSTFQVAEERNDKTSRTAQPLHIRCRGYLRSHLPSIIESLEQMVNINSYVDNIEGVNSLGNWISIRLEQLGFERRVYPQTEIGNVLYFTNHDHDQNDILLLGHMDTVYDFQNHIPFSEERGRIFGSGVAESKGGIAIMLAALQALRFSRVLRNVRCGILLTSDDNAGGRFSKPLVEEIAHHSKYVVGTKYGDLTGGIVSSCVGAQEYHIEMTTHKNHKNAKKRKRPDVAAALSRCALSIRKLNSEKKGITVVINSISARTNTGRISDHGKAVVTARFVSSEQGAELDREIQRIAGKDADGSLKVQVRFGARRHPVASTKANLKFFEKVMALSEKLEIHVKIVHRDIPADICHVPETIPVLGGFGPLGGDVRSSNEYIVRDSLIDRSALLALVISDSVR